MSEAVFYAILEIVELIVGAGALAEVVAAIGTVVVYATALNALTAKPKLPGYLSEQSDRHHIVRSAIEPHRIILGECVSSGPLIGAFSLDGPTGNKNEILYLVIALAGHECQEIGTVYLNDVASTDIKFGSSDYDVTIAGVFYIGDYDPATDTIIPSTGSITTTIDGNAFTLTVGGAGNQELLNDFIEDSINPSETTANQTNIANLVAQIQAHAAYANFNYTVVQGEASYKLCSQYSNMKLAGVMHVRSKTATPVVVSVSSTGNHLLEVCIDTVATSEDFIKINKHLGTADQAADADLLVDGAPYVTANHRVRGIAYLVCKLIWDREVWATGIPQIKAVVKGLKLYDVRTLTTAWSDNPVLAVYLILTNSSGMNVPASRVDTANFIAAANVCDELVDGRSAVTLGASEIGTLQTDGSYRSKVNAPSHGFRSGHSVVISGHGGTPSLDATWTIVVDNPNYFWVVANVTAASSGGTAQVKVKRYTCNGSFTLDEKPRDIMSAVLSSMGGRLTYWGGKYRVYPAVYDVPTITLTDSDLRGAIKGQIRASRRDLFNGVRGTYVDVDKKYQATDYPIYKSATYKTQDNGEEILGDLNLPFTNDPYIAQRLAKLELERNRRGRVIEFPAKFTALNLRIWDTVTLSLTNPSGWNGVYRVVTMRIESDEGLMLTLREEHSDIYAWSGSDATPTHVPGAAAPLPTDVPAPPTNLAYTILSFDVTACVRLTATAPADAFVHAYELEYQIAGDAGWTAIPAELGTDIDTIAPDIGITYCGVPAGDYVVRVRSVGDNGKKSIWVMLNVHVAAPDLSPMPNVTGLELCGQGNDTTFVSRDPKFCWLDAATYNVTPLAATTNAVGGAAAGGTDYAFRDYQVKFLDPDDVLVTTAYTTAPEITAPYDLNAREYERMTGTPGAYRTFTVEVRARGMQGQLSSTPARLTVSNPSPGLPTSVTIVANSTSIDVTLSPPRDVDWKGTLIWASTSAGFSPSGTAIGEGNVVYDGPDGNIRFSGLTPGTVYYARLASYDVFNKQELNYSQEYSATIPTFDPLDTVAPATPVGMTTATGMVNTNQSSLAFITTTWTANTEADIDHYILRGRRAGQTVWTEFQIAHPTVNFRYEYAIPGVTYEGQMAAVDKTGNVSAFSGTFSQVAQADSTAPATPTGLTVTAGIKSITIKIDANTEADLAGYELYVSTTSGFTPGAGNFVGSGNVTQHVYQAAVSVNTTYYVKVRAFDWSGNFSGYTAQGSATAYAVATAYIDNDAVTTLKRQGVNTMSDTVNVSGSSLGSITFSHNLGRNPNVTVYSLSDAAGWPYPVASPQNNTGVGIYNFNTLAQSVGITINYW